MLDPPSFCVIFTGATDGLLAIPAPWGVPEGIGVELIKFYFKRKTGDEEKDVFTMTRQIVV